MGILKCKLCGSDMPLPGDAPSPDGWQNWTDLVTIDASSGCIAGLKKDGSLVYALADGQYQFTQYTEQWQDVTMISAAEGYVVGLKKDGTAITTSPDHDPDFSFHQEKYEISQWTDLAAVCGGTYHTLGLRKDGTVLCTKSRPENGTDYGQFAVTSWENVRLP